METKSEKKWYISSTGQGVSLTLKGVAVAFIPLAISIAQSFNIELSETMLANLIESIFTAISALTIALGLIRKVKNRI